jgi:hypothetical protein
MGESDVGEKITKSQKLKEKIFLDSEVMISEFPVLLL